MTAMSPVPPAAQAGRAHVDLGRLRREVQAFLTDARTTGAFTPTVDCWLRGFDPRFSRELAARGWLGVTWPERFGGRNWPNAARFVITEELLRFGAPITAHWMGDRQIGPSLLRHGCWSNTDATARYSAPVAAPISTVRSLSYPPQPPISCC